MMADTYIKAYFQLIFAVQRRQALIRREWKDDLEKYITGIVQNHDHKLIAIGSMPDQLHILIGYNVNQKIPDLVEKIKTSSNHWIKIIFCKNSNLMGKKDAEPSHTHLNKLTKYQIIFSIRNLTIKKNPSGKNTMICFINLKFGLMKNMFLNSLKL